MVYPSLLRPTTTETISVAGQPLTVLKVERQFRLWRGVGRPASFNNKPLINFAGRPLFAGLGVHEFCRLSGGDARWVETYGAPAARPNLFTNWLDVPRKQQQYQLMAAAWVTELLQSVAAHNGGRYGGCRDVMSWHGATIIFAELKRLKKDRLQATQPAWLGAGSMTGL